MKNTTGYHARDGSVLIIVMIIMMVISIMGLGQLTNAKFAAVEASESIQRHQFEALAEMGAREFRAIIMDELNRQPFDRLNLISGVSIPTIRKRWVLDDQNKVIGGYDVFIAETTSSDPEMADYKITSIAYDETLKNRAQVETYVRLTSVNQDVWGTNSEGGVLFVSGDSIWGSIRSNGSFYIHNSPYIDGATKTAASYNVIDGSNSTAAPADVFNGGVKFNLAKINFDPNLVTDLRDEASLIIQDGSNIEFMPDGTYEITRTTVETIEGVDVESTTTVTNWIDSLGVSGKESDNIIYVDGSVTVRGKVAGTVSVVADGSITIDHSIVYASKADNPDPNSWPVGNEPEIQERLGLYATKKVMAVGSYGEDLNIHAAVFVTDENDPSTSTYIRGFCVEDYFENFGTPYINFYGSIIQNQRGAVGTTGGSGFYKNYHQDARFITSPPPGSPLSTPEFFGWESAMLGGR